MTSDDRTDPQTALERVVLGVDLAADVDRASEGTTSNPAASPWRNVSLGDLVASMKAMGIDRASMLDRPGGWFFQRPPPEPPEPPNISDCTLAMVYALESFTRPRSMPPVVVHPPTAAERAEASDPSTPGERLVELWQTWSELREAIEGNPNLHTPKLRELLKLGNGRAWRNPAASLELLELGAAERDRAFGVWCRFLTNRWAPPGGVRTAVDVALVDRCRWPSMPPARRYLAVVGLLDKPRLTAIAAAWATYGTPWRGWRQRRREDLATLEVFRIALGLEG